MKLSEAKEILRAAGIDSYDHDAKELFFELGGFQRGLLSPDAESDADRLTEGVMRRAAREPLQYLIGKAYFYREEYKVTPAVLIPRPDTEHLVDYAIRNIPEGESFADLCTGSGCIAISTLANTRATRAVALDFSPGALEIARENAKINGVSDRLDFIEADIFNFTPTGDEKYYAVLSNPPYVTERAYSELEPEIYREPESAFVGGEDGMDFYRVIVPLAKRMIKPDGFIALEIGYDQASAIRALGSSSGLSVEVIKDYSGNDRVAVMRRPKCE